MRFRRRYVLGALAAVGLAGCGSSTATTTSSTAPASSTTTASTTSVRAFKRDFASEKAQFTELGTDLAKAVEGANSKSNAELAAEFQSLADRAAQQAASLAKLGSPEKYRAELAQLTAGFASVASDLTAIKTAAAKGDPQAAKTATTKLVADAAIVKTHDQALTAALGLPQTR
jgi:hypothetical protein